MTRDWQGLYAMQDWVLARIRPLDQAFYLTGGTALSRGYYNHRYSEDLDFFVNDSADFELWRDRCFAALDREASSMSWRLEILLRDTRFGRAVLHGPVPLKLEFVNDVPFRVGEPGIHPSLGRLDTRENILANKVSAIVDRRAPKDLADIYWMCCRDGLSLPAALEGASGKAAGIFPPLVARVLSETAGFGVPNVPWVRRPDETEFKQGIDSLIVRIMEGSAA